MKINGKNIFFLIKENEKRYIKKCQKTEMKKIFLSLNENENKTFQCESTVGYR